MLFIIFALMLLSFLVEFVWIWSKVKLLHEHGRHSAQRSQQRSAVGNARAVRGAHRGAMRQV